MLKASVLMIFYTLFLNIRKKRSVPVLIDPKGKNWEKYSGAFLVKPNLLELSDIIGYTIPNEDHEIEKAGKEVLNMFDIRNLVITRSSKGMSIISEDAVHHLEAHPVDVFDVTGAGDTVLAVIAQSLHNRKSLLEAVTIANKAASEVVKQFGVVTYKNEN